MYINDPEQNKLHRQNIRSSPRGEEEEGSVIYHKVTLPPPLSVNFPKQWGRGVFTWINGQISGLMEELRDGLILASQLLPRAPR